MLLFVTLRMVLQGNFFVRTFTFCFDARTSRGSMKTRRSWFIRIADPDEPGKFGLGECGPLPGLSVDYVPDFERVLASSLNKLSATGLPDRTEDVVRSVVPEGFPSVTFGMETALRDLAHGGRRLIYDNGFVRGTPIPINGLVWMGDYDFMLDQVHSLVEKGFTCIKLKIGGLDFDRECELLKAIRGEFGSSAITLRLDANGAFDEATVADKLDRLAEFSIHSIEQPLKPGSEKTIDLCRQSPIAIALDEELIGKENAKRELLERIRPAFIVLKPTLHGGLTHCADWINVAESLTIGWWITSALESNIGLNAISQFTAGYSTKIPQGLGTGSIYSDNFASPLKVVNGHILSDPGGSW
jgi:o-succinylbenzoate synthase